MRKAIVLLLTAALLCSIILPASAEFTLLSVGDAMPDFSVATLDGTTFSLSEALETKQAVLIKFWATWCGPCRVDFPYLDAAWREWQNRVSVIALSIEPTDTDDKLSAFAEELGITCPIGSDADLGLFYRFGFSAIPSYVLIDRYGVIVAAQTGVQSPEVLFDNAFRVIASDEYSESLLLGEMPLQLGGGTSATPEELDAALNTPGGTLRFSNDPNPIVWSMVPADVDGRHVLTTATSNIDEAVSAVRTEVDALDGDCLSFAFRTSTLPGLDRLELEVDGQVEKVFSGSHDWTSYAYPLASGHHSIALRYAKNPYFGGQGEDVVMIDDVALLSGSDAQEALERNPEDPRGASTDYAVVNDGAVRISFSDPNGRFAANFGEGPFFICGDTALVQVGLDPDVDPEGVLLISSSSDQRAYDGRTLLAGPVEIPIDTYEEDGYCCTYLYLFTNSDPQNYDAYVLFESSEEADTFVRLLASEGLETSWRYEGE